MRGFEPQISLAEFDDVTYMLNRLDEIIEESPDMEEKRIFVINQLHFLGLKSPYVIGKLLKDQEIILIKNYESWQGSGKVGKPPAKSLYEWFQTNDKKVAFSYEMARRYITVFMSTDREVTEKIGVTKSREIAKADIPDEKKRDIEQKTADLGWNTEKVKEEVEKAQVALQRKQEFKKKVMPKLPKYDTKIKAKTIIIELESDEVRDAFVQYLNEKRIAIKTYIFQKIRKG